MQGAPGVGSGDLEVGNEEGTQRAGNAVPLKGTGPRNGAAGEAAPGAVGVAFEFGAKLEDGIGTERLAGEFVQAMEEPQAHGHTAPHPARTRHGTGDFPLKFKRLAAGFLKNAAAACSTKASPGPAGDFFTVTVL